MTVYFYNDETIDLAAVTILGVSVKDSDSAIGYFGTGLKFAISTLLRTGHKVSIFTEGKENTFGTEKAIIRDEEFDVVTMNGEKLGFTTKMGRDWEVWQAYRELHSNCLDEGGTISDEEPAETYGTEIVVSGSEITTCYHGRHEIFLPTTPVAVSGVVEFHKGEINKTAYYKGVKAHKLQNASIFTYNITNGQVLTEDRSIKSTYDYKTKIEHAVITCDDEDVILLVILAKQGSFEHSLDLHHEYITPSHAFMRVVNRNRSNNRLSKSARKQWEHHAKDKLEPKVVQLDDFDIEQFEKAQVLLRRLDCDIELSDFVTVEDLGIGCFGKVAGAKIYICKKTFDQGYRFLASTLYEEWLHHNHGYKDESRELQNLLFERLFSVVDRLTAKEGPLDKVHVLPKISSSKHQDEIPF